VDCLAWSGAEWITLWSIAVISSRCEMNTIRINIIIDAPFRDSIDIMNPYIILDIIIQNCHFRPLILIPDKLRDRVYSQTDAETDNKHNKHVPAIMEAPIRVKIPGPGEAEIYSKGDEQRG
jgi:hypothetical protein